MISGNSSFNCQSYNSLDGAKEIIKCYVTKNSNGSIAYIELREEKNVISESSINKCWEEAMKYYLNNSYSRNICGKEYMFLDNLTVQANNYVLEPTLSPFCPWGIKSREYYISQITSPGKHSEINRLYSFGPNRINQYKYTINNIKKRKNIKPIVIPIYDPHKDNREYVPTPCISNIILDTWNEVVNMHVNYSTMNLFRMGLLDYHQMAFLHHTIANDTCKKIGYLRIFSVQIHMPIFDFFVSKNIFDIENTIDCD